VLLGIWPDSSDEADAEREMICKFCMTELVKRKGSAKWWHAKGTARKCSRIREQISWNNLDENRSVYLSDFDDCVEKEFQEGLMEKPQ